MSPKVVMENEKQNDYSEAGFVDDVNVFVVRERWLVGRAGEAGWDVWVKLDLFFGYYLKIVDCVSKPCITGWVLVLFE